MPIKIQDSLPAQSILEQENIFVMTDYRAMHQDIRPLKVLILNLMPNKEVTETQLLRKLSNSPLQVDVELLTTVSYDPTHVDSNHLNSFYTTFDKVKNGKYDGLIVTGAPLEFVDYEEVAYWKELCEILDWAKSNVHCSLFICWAAFAALYHYYDIPKQVLNKKISGVYPCRVMKNTSPLFRGFDDEFLAPQSRFMMLNAKEIENIPNLELMANCDEAGVTICKDIDSRHFFVTCHLEYDSCTLSDEYFRDLEKGMNPEIPYNYFPDNDPSRQPPITWRAYGQLLYSNWLNYYVYQSTPYDVEAIGNKN